MLKSVLSVLVILAVILIGGFGIYAWHSSLPAMSQAERPHFDAATVEQGRVLAAAGFCATCHTAPGGAPYAGNYPLATGFGTIYASNITPDVETGIGAWSPEAFRRAMQQGVDRQGRNLFPAFPYDHFTKMSDADVDAIYAYLMTEVAPVRQVTKPSTIPFPLNIRFLQSGWKLLFVDFGRYHPDPSQSAAWNRGAYLAEGLSHCGACHTPRNALGAEQKGSRYAGAVIEGWTAPALNGTNPSAVPWSTAAFTNYLQTGSETYHGVASGPMAEVVAGLNQLPASDIAAIGTYLGSLTNAPAGDPAQSAAVAASIKAGTPDPDYRKDTGERLYATACAACHYNASPASLTPTRPDLGIESAARLDDPTNMIHVILDGIPAKQGAGGVAMPGFRPAFDDDQIAAVANYIRTVLAGLPPWQGLAAKVASVRAEGGAN